MLEMQMWLINMENLTGMAFSYPNCPKFLNPVCICVRRGCQAAAHALCVPHAPASGGIPPDAWLWAEGSTDQQGPSQEAFIVCSHLLSHWGRGQWRWRHPAGGPPITQTYQSSVCIFKSTFLWNSFLSYGGNLLVVHLIVLFWSITSTLTVRTICANIFTGRVV